MELSGNGADSDPLLFVYGSLKRGMTHHGELSGAAELESARLEGLALYDLGPFPMAICCNQPGCTVEGELYQVSPDQLAHLDRFEGAPKLYQRRRLQLSDGTNVWVYVGRERQVRHSPRVTSGCWNGPVVKAKREINT
jgi:gamma-glutamylcyclotransferase (GGCT)/AIG2-like uncharacterized protein YtfP